jgi:hypothetical protein
VNVAASAREKRHYSVVELQNTQLWERLDKRIAELGGPDKVRALYAEAVERTNRASIATSVK